MTSFPNIYTEINSGFVDTPGYMQYVYTDEFKQLGLVAENKYCSLEITGDHQLVTKFFTKLENEQKARNSTNTNDTIIIRKFDMKVDEFLNLFDTDFSNFAFESVDFLEAVEQYSPDINIIQRLVKFNVFKALENSVIHNVPYDDCTEGVYFILLPGYTWKMCIRG